MPISRTMAELSKKKNDSDGNLLSIQQKMAYHMKEILRLTELVREIECRNESKGAEVENQKLVTKRKPIAKKTTEAGLQLKLLEKRKNCPSRFRRSNAGYKQQNEQRKKKYSSKHKLSIKQKREKRIQKQQQLLRQSEEDSSAFEDESRLISSISLSSSSCFQSFSCSSISMVYSESVDHNGFGNFNAGGESSHSEQVLNEKSYDFI